MPSVNFGSEWAAAAIRRQLCISIRRRAMVAKSRSAVSHYPMEVYILVFFVFSVNSSVVSIRFLAFLVELIPCITYLSLIFVIVVSNYFFCLHSLSVPIAVRRYHCYSYSVAVLVQSPMPLGQHSYGSISRPLGGLR